jgi:hypothetical protein
MGSVVDIRAKIVDVFGKSGSGSHSAGSGAWSPLDDFGCSLFARANAAQIGATRTSRRLGLDVVVIDPCLMQQLLALHVMGRLGLVRGHGPLVLSVSYGLNRRRSGLLNHLLPRILWTL